MAEYKEITNEKVKLKFKSQFDLVSYAIRLAENMIKTGRDARVKIDSQNRSMQVLAEISAGKDIFDDVSLYVNPPPLQNNNHSREERQGRDRDSRDDLNGKNSERKKTRKII